VRLVAFIGCLVLIIVPASHAQQEGGGKATPTFAAPKPPPAWSDDHLKDFMRELARYAVDKHVEKDPQDPQFGMIYELYQVKNGKWYQGETLDTMHDGAWFATALCMAYRATKDPYYLDILRKYPLAFYKKVMLNADRLFGYPKGTVPYWWDDGDSISLEDGKVLNGCRQGPHMTSNHMAQDLAVMLFNAWLLTRDPELARCAKYLWDERRNNTDEPASPAAMFVNTVAAGFTNADESILNQAGGDKYEYQPWSRYYRGLYEWQETDIPPYDDGLAFEYFATLTGKWGQRRLDEDFGQRMVEEALTVPYQYQLWMDHRDYEWGLHLFEIQGQPKMVNGRFEKYHSEWPTVWYGPRGLQLEWEGLIGLQMLKALPNAWEAHYQRHYADDHVLVPILDWPEDLWTNVPMVRTEEAGCPLYSLTQFLLLGVEHAAGDLNLQLASEEKPDDQWLELAWDAQQHALRITGPAGDVTAYEPAELGQPLEPRPANAEDEVVLLYTAAKSAQPWLNGVEHGRYLFVTGNQGVKLYFLSPQERVHRRLRNAGLGAVDFYHRFYREQGFLPFKFRYDERGKVVTDDFSDSGSYAHLIALIAQVLIERHDQRDWDLALTTRAP